MRTYKKVNKNGSITLPRVIRQEAGLVVGVAIDIVTDEDGVHITKHVPTCFHCGSVERVASCLGLEICQDCVGKLQEVFDDART